MALTDKLSAIADAIRAKTGKTDSMTLDQMPTEIASITTGGGGGGSAEGFVTVTFMNGDVELFTRPVYIGDDCPNPVDQKRIDTPTKESTAQYNYGYLGWGASNNGAVDSNILKNITEDKTVYAIYSSILRFYTVTWLDDDGTVLNTESKSYGSTPSYSPIKTGYDFAGWIPAVSVVTGDATYTAQWEEAGVVDEEIADDWDAIIAACADGSYATKYKVGNYKPLEVNGFTHNMQIVAKDTDILADGTGTAPLTFIAKNIKNTTMGFVAWGRTTWDANQLKTKYIPEEFTQHMPENIMAAVKEVTKITKGTNSDKVDVETETTEKIWIPSMRELKGTTEQQGVVYAVYVSGEIPLKKGNFLCAYWLRTHSGTSHWYVKDDGAVSTSSDTWSGLPLCFCL